MIQSVSKKIKEHYIHLQWEATYLMKLQYIYIFQEILDLTANYAD